MNKIAIKGHHTRGNDVIKILKALGGNNYFDFAGTIKTCYYFIDNNNQI